METIPSKSSWPMGNKTVNLVTGVRVAECEALRRSWSGWVEPKP